MKPRDYQLDCINATWNEITVDTEQRPATLALLPTGTGKTIVFGHLADRWIKEERGRVLILAHRRELIDQAAAKFHRVSGHRPHIEMADKHASKTSHFNWDFGQVVVGSVATMKGKRLGRWDKNAFSLIITDEAHHATASGYRSIYDHFDKAALVGVTATPDRSDKNPLGKVFGSVAYQMQILDAIQRGWLVPIRQKFVNVESIDLSGVASNWKGDDFDESKLDAVMRQDENIHRIARPTFETAGTRPTLVFATSVAHAKAISDVLNSYRQGCSAYVASYMLDNEGNQSNYPEETRTAEIAAFQAGQRQFLVSCGVFLEGFDCLDMQTEVLTDEGWKHHAEISEMDNVYTLNRTTGVMELLPIERVVLRTTKPGESMVTFKSQHLDIRVTEGHEIHVKYSDPRKRRNGNTGEHALSDNFITLKASELLDRSEYILPISADHGYAGIPLTDDEIRFVAWFMTDGGYASKQKISIAQSIKKHHEHIRQLLRRVGFDFRERLRTGQGYVNGAPCYEFTIPKGTDGGSKKRNGWGRLADYLSKDVSPLLHSMNREQFHIFWQEALLGDGSRKKNGSGWLWCDRKKQADAYTQMAVTRGFATSYAEETTKKGVTVYRVTVRNKRWIRSNNHDVRSTRITKEVIESTELVWCVSNANSTLVVRRNGKVAIVGNCPPTALVAMARPTKSRSLYAQALGRGTRPLDGVVDPWPTAEERIAAIAASAKPDMLVMDFVGNSGKHKLVYADEVLFPDVDAATREKARKKAKDQDSADVRETMEQAEAEVEQEKQVKVAEIDKLRRRLSKQLLASFTMRDVDPFGHGESTPELNGYKVEVPASEKQVRFVMVLAKKLGKRYDFDAVMGMGRNKVRGMIASLQGQLKKREAVA